MRKPPRPPIPPTAKERDDLAPTYSYILDGTVVSLTREALKQVVIHRRDAASASRHERRRMAAIMHSNRVQARVNKAIQRQLDKVERRARPLRIRVRVEPENRRAFKRKPPVIRSRSLLPLPRYARPIIDRQGRRGIVMTIDYDGAKKHSFGIMRRRIVYASDPEHCEADAHGVPIFFSNMGEDVPEILMGADLVELAQRESRADAKLNVNIVIQMPHDVPQEVRQAILRAVAHELFGRHGLPYAAALHEPDPDGDQRNFHGHICGSWRPMKRTAPYCWEVAQDFRSDLDGAQYWRHARRRVAEIMTATVEREGLDRCYTHLSNAERGLVHKPQKKLDKRKTRSAREGEFVADVEANRRRIEANIALEAKLEAKRKQRRERALKRRLAALARVELAVRKPLEVRPAAPPEPHIGTVLILPVPAPPPVTPLPAQTVERVGEQPARETAATIGATAPFELAQSLRTVVRSGSTVQGPRAARPVHIEFEGTAVTGDATVPSAPFPPGPDVLKPVTSASSLLEALAHQVKPVPNIAAAAPTGEVASIMHEARPASDVRAVEFRQAVASPARPVVTGATNHGSRMVPSVAPQAIPPIHRIFVPVRHGDAIKAVVPLSRPSGVTKAVGTIDNVSLPVPHVTPVAMHSPDLSQMPPTGPVVRAVSRSRVASAVHAVPTVAPAQRRQVLRPVKSFDTPIGGRVRTVSPVPDGAAIGPTPAIVHGIGTRSPLPIRPVASRTQNSIDPALVLAMRLFTERLAKVAALRPQRSPAQDTHERDDRLPASQEMAAELRPPLVLRVSAFANAMRRKPSGLCLWDDGSIHPLYAVASSWGLSKADLASETAKRAFLPLYVEQELRLERLENELKFACVSQEELRDPEMRFASRLSKAAVETLKMYDRSELIYRAFDRVCLELWCDHNVVRRTVQLDRHGIDWRTIAQLPKGTQKAIISRKDMVESRGIGR